MATNEVTESQVHAIPELPGEAAVGHELCLETGLMTLPSSQRRLLFFDSSHPTFAQEKPYYSNIPFLKSRAANSNVETKGVEIPLMDARGYESKLGLDTNGFELVQWRHSLEDIQEGVSDATYAAVGRLLRERLGSDVRVVVFDHTFRRSTPGQTNPSHGMRPNGKNGTPDFGRPSSVAHSDQTYEGTIKQIKTDFKTDAQTLLQHRFRVINVWKPLKTPVRQWPLVLCDYRTCKGDGHPCDLVYPHSVSENLMFAHSERQRWYHVSDQDRDETWLIKIMDSESENNPSTAQYAAHTSCFDPEPSLANEVRESVEFRAYVFGE